MQFYMAKSHMICPANHRSAKARGVIQVTLTDLRTNVKVTE